jgi:cation:H+ antiporter
MFLPYILLFAGFLLLIKGADFLVEGASSIARRFNVSDLVIGLTVVAFGTSTPELFVNILASIQGNTGIAIGNVLGSNISNILLILGVSAIICPLTVGQGTVWKEIPLSFLAVIVLAIVANDHILDHRDFSEISRTDGLIFLSFFVIFIYYSVGVAKKIEGMDDHVPPQTHAMFKSVVLALLGLIGLTLGGHWIVDGAVKIASRFGMSQSLVGLTVVAVGTSLPELATSAMAAYKKNVEIAVGNVVGSNIFNIFFVLGISSTIKPLPFQTVNNLDIGVVVLASTLLFGSVFTGKKKSIDKWEGVVFLLLYIGYIAYLVVRG